MKTNDLILFEKYFTFPSISGAGIKKSSEYDAMKIAIIKKCFKKINTSCPNKIVGDITPAKLRYRKIHFEICCLSGDTLFRYTDKYR